MPAGIDANPKNQKRKRRTPEDSASNLFPTLPGNIVSPPYTTENEGLVNPSTRSREATRIPVSYMLNDGTTTTTRVWDQADSVDPSLDREVILRGVGEHREPTRRRDDAA